MPEFPGQFDGSALPPSALSPSAGSYGVVVPGTTESPGSRSTSWSLVPAGTTLQMAPPPGLKSMVKAPLLMIQSVELKGLTVNDNVGEARARTANGKNLRA